MNKSFAEHKAELEKLLTSNSYYPELDFKMLQHKLTCYCRSADEKRELAELMYKKYKSSIDRSFAPENSKDFNACGLFQGHTEGKLREHYIHIITIMTKGDVAKWMPSDAPQELRTLAENAITYNTERSSLYISKKTFDLNEALHSMSSVIELANLLHETAQKIEAAHLTLSKDEKPSTRKKKPLNTAKQIAKIKIKPRKKIKFNDVAQPKEPALEPSVPVNSPSPHAPTHS